MATKHDLLRIYSDKGERRLLTLNVVDGQLHAEYDEADLDTAAKIFVDTLKNTWAAAWGVEISPKTGEPGGGESNGG